MAIYNRTADELMGREIWLKFATWILLGLEFALAADLLRTAVASDLGGHRQARGDRRHPHHAQLFSGEGHRRLRRRPAI